MRFFTGGKSKATKQKRHAEDDHMADVFEDEAGT